MLDLKRIAESPEELNRMLERQGVRDFDAKNLAKKI